MKYEFCYGRKIACLPADILGDKLRSCGELELRVLCALSLNERLLDGSAAALAEALGCKRADAERALEQKRKNSVSGTASKMVNKAASSAMSTIGREVGKQLLRGVFGTLKK